MRKSVTSFVPILMFLVPASLCAQDDARVGLVTGYPATIGIIWHATARFAVRPDFNFSWSSTERQLGLDSDPGAKSRTTNTGIGFGVSGLFYSHATDSFRLYVVPRFGYNRTNVKFRLTSREAESGRSEGNSVTVSGSAGGQYSLHRRFAVFGEAGVLYSHLDATDSSSSVFTSPETDQTGNAWSTRTAIGVIVYF